MGRKRTLAIWGGGIGIAAVVALTLNPLQHIAATQSGLATAGNSGGITGTCVIGYEDMFSPNGVQVNSDNTGAQTPLFIAGGIPAADEDQPVMAYRLTLANDGSSLAEVSGYQVVFTRTDGSETGSEQMSVTVQAIEPGAALAWVGGIGDGNAGAADEADPYIPADSAGCTLVSVTDGGSGS